MSLASGALTQLQVIHAVALRETRTRFGRHRLGYLWALIEPALWILTFYLFFYAVGRHTPTGMDLASFIATGFIPYSLFARTADATSNAVAGNLALLSYRQVKPVDLVLARTALEGATQATVFAIVMGLHALVAGHITVDDALELILGFLSAGALGASLGSIFCSVAVLWNTVDRIRGPLLRPLFWFSGIFFTANEIPNPLLSVLRWNPVLHATELVRSGWFLSYESRVADLRYIAGWVLVMTFVGGTLERAVRHRIEVP